jgi:predicted RND superfamily exporter protein
LSNFDERAKDELKARTDKDLQGLKDEIWNELEKELFSTEKLNSGVVKKMKKRNRAIPIIITVAAGLLIAFSLQTDTGMAFMKGIKDMFVPEKDVIQNIEGMDEETEVQLNEGTNSEYVIYVDETRYKLINGEESDIITTINPLPENYPEVTMEIKQVADEKPEALVEKFEAELKKTFLI